MPKSGTPPLEGAESLVSLPLVWLLWVCMVACHQYVGIVSHVDVVMKKMQMLAYAHLFRETTGKPLTHIYFIHTVEETVWCFWVEFVCGLSCGHGDLTQNRAMVIRHLPVCVD